jgi:WD40 repeat protein
MLAGVTLACAVLVPGFQSPAQELKPGVTLSAQVKNVRSIAFSPDGKRFATGTMDGTIQLWDPATGKEQATLKEGRPRVVCVVFSPDSTLLASGQDDNTIQLWDLGTGKVKTTLNSLGGDSLCFSPDGKMLFSGGGFIKMWDVATGKSKWQLFSPGRSLAVSPDGTTLASGGELVTAIKLWDVSKGKEKATIIEPTAGVRSLVFTPDGKTLVAGGHSLKLWDVATRREKAALIREKRPPDRFGLGTYAGARAGWSVALSPDGNTLVEGGAVVETEGKTPGAVGTIRMWDVKTGKETAKVTLGTGQVFSVAFSPDGKMLAAGGSDEAVLRLWEVIPANKKD